jgi:hypothetical protein
MDAATNSRGALSANLSNRRILFVSSGCIPFAHGMDWLSFEDDDLSEL